MKGIKKRIKTTLTARRRAKLKIYAKRETYKFISAGVSKQTFNRILHSLTYYGSPRKRNLEGGFRENRGRQISLRTGKPTTMISGGKTFVPFIDDRLIKALSIAERTFKEHERGILINAMYDNVLHSLGKKHNQMRERYGTNFINRLNTLTIEQNLSSKDLLRVIKTDVMRMGATTKAEHITHYIKGLGSRLTKLFTGQLNIRQSDLTAAKIDAYNSARTLRAKIWVRTQLGLSKIWDIIRAIFDSDYWQEVRKRERDAKELEKIERKNRF